MRVVKDIEIELLSGLKAGREAAFAKLYALHSKAIYAFVLKLLKSPSLSEDVVQEVFIKLWENASRIDPTSSIKPYLFTIARNLSLNVIRKASKEQIITQEIAAHAFDQADDALAATQHKQTQAFIADAIAQLPPKRREIYQLCHGDGYSYKQAAEKLGIKDSTINSQMVKALRSIKQHLIKNGALLLLYMFK